MDDATTRIDWHTGVPLAQGGSGEIVRAFSPDLGREIAIKYLRLEEPGAIERMLREARTQGALSHPHILPVHATGVHLDRHYIAMDLVDGEPLDRYLADRSTDRKLAVFDQVLDAMAYAHAEGVVHRDLKPANVMVEERDGQPHAWIMDFGLARRPDDATLTLAGDALGTPGYMAPEQARGAEGADPRADIYALGVVLYQVLTGTLPYTADTPMALVMQAASGRILPISQIRRRLPEGLARIVVRCLETDPARRYRDAGDLRADLAAFGDGRSIEAPVLGRKYRIGRWTRANPWRARLAIALGAVLFIGGTSLIAMSEQNRRALDAASNLIAEAERARGDWYIDQLLPLHDQRPALLRARDTVTRLADAGDRLGEIAAARIDAALADLLDAIGEPARAFDHAERAWQGGVRNTSVAHRAARARLQQFGARRLELALTADTASQGGLLADARNRLTRDLEPYRELLGADMLRRLDRALNLEHGANTPGLDTADRTLMGPDDWQSLLLDLQVQAAGAIDRLNIDGQSALAALAEVDTRLEELIGTARSYLPAYRLACTIAAARQSLSTMQTEATAVETTRDACDRGLRLVVDDSELLATSSMHLWLRAKDLRRDRQAFSEPLDRSIAQARQALDVDPDNELAQLSLGSALQVLGRKQLAAGEDPEAALDASLRWLERVHHAGPNDVNVMNNLAVTWSTISAARSGAGDPRGALAADRQSLVWLERAAETAPDDRRLSHNMLMARTSLLYQASLLGENPTESTRHTVEQLRALATAHPDYISPLNTLGLAWWTQGLWNAWTGEDPTPAMRAARAAFDETLQLRPDWESARINRAGVARQWYAAARQPGPDLEAMADAALATYLELEPEGADKYEFGCLRAEILVARAQWRSAEEADRLLQEAFDLSNPRNNIEWTHVDCLRVRARMGHVWLALGTSSTPIESLWADTLEAAERSEAPGLLMNAMAFARARGDDVSARRWRDRLPEAFRP